MDYIKLSLEAVQSAFSKEDKNPLWDQFIKKTRSPQSDLQIQMAAVETQQLPLKNEVEAYLNIVGEQSRLEALLLYTWSSRKRDDFTTHVKHYTQLASGLVEGFVCSNEISGPSPQSINLLGSERSMIASDEAAITLQKYNHQICRDVEAARWDIVDGVWQRVPFIIPNKDAKKPHEVNPAFFTAKFEDMYFSTGDEMEYLIPDSLLNGADAASWLADIQALDENGQQVSKSSFSLYLRAVVGYAVQPIKPHSGAVLRFRRYDPKIN